MLTREEEGGRLKCHRYWPNESDVPSSYGPYLTVELLDKEMLPESDGSIIRRHFRMRYIPTGATRIVVQLQYIGWPDFGVPNTPLAVLQLRAAVLAGPRIREESQFDDKVPQDRPATILVHCSAGCGRTGAFCTIDSTLRLLERVDGPFGCSDDIAIANDIVVAKREAEIEARNQEKAEQEEAKQPLALSAFSTGTFSVAAALKPDPTPDTFCLKMPKFLKGNRRGARLESTPATMNDSTDKTIPPTDMRPPCAPLRNRCGFSSTSTCETSQTVHTESHPPLAPSVVHKMGPSAQFKPLAYPNLMPSAESRCTRDIVRGCVEVFREQRVSMVQTLRQFVFCYEAVLWHVMGAANPAGGKRVVEDIVAGCGRPLEERRHSTSPAGTQKARMTEAEHMCCALSMRPAYQTPGRSSMTTPERVEIQAGNALLRFESLEVIPKRSDEFGLRDNKKTESRLVNPTAPSPADTAARLTGRMNLVLPSSIRAKINRGLDNLERQVDPRLICPPCVTDETRADVSTAIDVATLSVSPALPSSHKSSTTYSSTVKVNRSQGTSPRLALQMEGGRTPSLERGSFLFGSSLNPLGSRNGGNLQGDLLNAAFRTSVESKGRESACHDKKENAAPSIRTPRRRSIKRKEVEDYFSVRPAMSPPAHIGTCVSGDDPTRHHAPSSWRTSSKPNLTAQLSSPIVGTASFAFQNSTARLPSAAFAAVSSTLSSSSMHDVYGRRRSDPCVALNALSLLRITHDDPITPGASSPLSCHPRISGHHPSDFERVVRKDTTPKGLRSHHIRPPPSSASESSNPLYHTRSASASSIGFGPVGMSPSLLSH